MAETPTSQNAVLDIVRKSELIDEDALAEFLTSHPDLPAGASDTASHLVRAGLLTTFQAKLILQGRYKGFKLGPYKILDQIGAGGMGQVFLAEHVAMRRRVALKVLPAQQAQDRATLERFYREARAVAALDHPNIVRAHDVCQDRGAHFIVLEYAEGKNLAELLKDRNNRMPFGEAAGYIVQAAAGLQHAHERGLVHRDVKPANLVLTREGVVKVLDMGLARFFEDRVDNITKNLDGGAVMGTADYVAPEQLIDSTAVDHRADVYSLGATLYQMVTGQTPFDGTLTAKMVAHHLQEASPAHEVNPDVPEALSAVISRMMAKLPADRYPTMTAAREALLPFAAASSVEYGSGVMIGDTLRNSAGASAISLRPTSIRLPHASDIHATTADIAGASTRARPGDRQSTSTRPGKAGWLIGLTALAALVGGGTWFALTRPDLDPTRVPAVPNTGPAASEPNASATSPTPGTGAVDPGTVTPPTPTPPTPAIASPTIPTLAVNLVLPEKTYTEAMAFSLDGKWVLTGSSDRIIRVWDAVEGKLVKSLDGHGSAIRGLAMLADGKRFLSTGADKSVRLWDLDSPDNVSARKYGGPAAFTGIAAVPNGRRFVTTAMDGGLWLWDLGTGAVVHKYETLPVGVMAAASGALTFAAREGKRPGPPLPPLTALAMARDGRRVVVASGDPRWTGLAPPSDAGAAPALAVIDLASGRELRRALVPVSIAHLAVSPDGRKAAFGTVDGIGIWDLESGSMRMPSGTRGRTLGVTFTPDGRHVLATGADKTLSLWEVETGRLLAAVPAGPGVAVAVAPDGTRAALGGSAGLCSVWRMPAAAIPGPADPNALSVVRVLTGVEGFMEDVIFTADGTRVIGVANNEPLVRFWDAATGEQVLQLPIEPPANGARTLALLAGDRLAFSEVAREPGVRIWDLKTATELRRIPPHDFALAALPDGQRLLVGVRTKAVLVINADTGDELAKHKVESTIRGLAATPDGKAFLVGSMDNTVRLHDLGSGVEMRRFKGTENAWRIGVSPDSRWAAFRGEARGLTLWDLKSGEAHQMEGPDKKADGAVFTRDGRHVLAVVDRGLFIWEVATRKLVASAVENTASGRCVALSPDGRFAVTSSSDMTAIIWRLPAFVVPSE